MLLVFQYLLFALFIKVPIVIGCLRGTVSLAEVVIFWLLTSAYAVWRLSREDQMVIGASVQLATTPSRIGKVYAIDEDGIWVRGSGFDGPYDPDDLVLLSNNWKLSQGMLLTALIVLDVLTLAATCYFGLSR